MKYFAAVVAILGLCVSNAAAISCQDQAGNRGPRCVAPGAACPNGFRPVFYDQSTPCKPGDRCCI
ncbi:hypothetical protein BDV18DRAFT_155570 [Aspergillus unguis]